MDIYFVILKGLSNDVCTPHKNDTADNKFILKNH